MSQPLGSFHVTPFKLLWIHSFTACCTTGSGSSDLFRLSTFRVVVNILSHIAWNAQPPVFGDRFIMLQWCEDVEWNTKKPIMFTHCTWSGLNSCRSDANWCVNINPNAGNQLLNAQNFLQNNPHSIRPQIRPCLNHRHLRAVHKYTNTTCPLPCWRCSVSLIQAFLSPSLLGFQWKSDPVGISCFSILLFIHPGAKKLPGNKQHWLVTVVCRLCNYIKKWQCVVCLLLSNITSLLIIYGHTLNNLVYTGLL